MKTRSVFMKHVAVAVAVAIWCLALPSYGATQLLADVTVTRITTDASSYAGCLARINVNPADSLPACGDNHVTMGCDGTLGVSKATAAQLFSAMQLALVTGNPMRIRVDDSKIANGFCMATRVDNED